jgi:hypothetical protein
MPPMPQIFGIAVVAHLPIITFLAIEATGKWVMMEPVAKLHQRAELSGLRGDLRGVREPVR